jgi:hypothetical protein
VSQITQSWRGLSLVLPGIDPGHSLTVGVAGRCLSWVNSDLAHSRSASHLAKVYAISAKETAMTNDHTLDIRVHAAIAELTEDQLKKASGGFVSVEHTVVAPRDSASGIATGRRSH